MFYSLEDINYHKVKTHGKFNAGNKAHEDVIRFLGADTLYCVEHNGNKVSRMLQAQVTKRKVKKLPVLLQYPFYMSDYYKNMFVFNNRSVCLIHDLYSLREKKAGEYEKEISYLNQFNVVIAHNESMIKWLKEHGYNKELISLDIFDYDTKSELCDVKFKSEGVVKIAFAGNIDKSPFIVKLGDDYEKDIVWRVFGAGTLPEGLKSNIKYCGKFLPDDLPKELLESDFGLVWDGQGIMTCDGNMGEYLRYNNPHKCSLYLAAGIPVIIWKEAALASFVTREKCGIAVESLDEARKIIRSMSEKEYIELRTNAARLSKSIRNGEHIKKAVNTAQQLLNQKEE